MLSLHLLQISLVYVNTLMIQRVPCRVRVAKPPH
jgi:TnpA family transposase